MTDKRPLSKEQIQERFKELCMVLGDLESKHQMHKAQLVQDISNLHFEHEQRLKVEAEEAEKANTAEKPKSKKAK